MLILGVTTSSPVCGVALRRGGVDLGCITFEGARRCLEALMPNVEKLLAENGLEISSPDVFALDAGPGGLTGVKVGLVTVRTMAQVAGKPVAPVSSLHAVAFAAPPDELLIFTASDCSATEVFTGIYSREKPGGAPVCVSPDRLDTPESAARRLLEAEAGGNLCLTGAAAARVLEKLAEIAPGVMPRVAPPETSLPDARMVCEIAETSPRVEWRGLQANYLSITQAEKIPVAERAGVKSGVTQ